MLPLLLLCLFSVVRTQTGVGPRLDVFVGGLATSPCEGTIFARRNGLEGTHELAVTATLGGITDTRCLCSGSSRCSCVEGQQCSLNPTTRLRLSINGRRCYFNIRCAKVARRSLALSKRHRRLGPYKSLRRLSNWRRTLQYSTSIDEYFISNSTSSSSRELCTTRSPEQ